MTSGVNPEYVLRTTTPGDKITVTSSQPARAEFPPLLEQVPPGTPVRRQTFGWLPGFFAFLGFLIAYRGAFYVRPGFERVGYTTAAIAFALGALLVFYEWKRRTDRMVLCFSGDAIGVYRRGQLKYTTSAAQMVPYKLHPFNTGRMVLFAGGLTVALLYAGLFAGKTTPKDRIILTSMGVLAGIFCASVVRLRMFCDWYLFPSEKGRRRHIVFPR